MKKLFFICCLLLLLLIQSISAGKITTFIKDDFTTLYPKVVQDHQYFYSWKNLSWVGSALALSAVMANTTMDEDIQQWFQNDIRTSGTDDFSKTAELFGNDIWNFGFFASITLLGRFTRKTRVGNFAYAWGETTYRAYLIGAPLVYVLQWTIGSSRPNTKDGSRWHIFNNEIGVSGHTYLGAAAFLTLRNMVDNRVFRWSCTIASTFTSLSRINDNMHYSSQSFMGWFLAYSTVKSVINNESKTVTTEVSIKDGRPYLTML